jgi:hypothetical protein
MKKIAIQIMSLVVLTVSFAVVSANAQAGVRCIGNIPFDFNVGKTSFKAGDYTIRFVDPSSENGAVVISDSKGMTSKIVMSIPKDLNAQSGVSNIVFNRYDDRYFMSEISTPTMAAAFSQSNVERQLAKKRESQRETVAVKRQK